MKQWRARLIFMATMIVIGAASLVLNNCGGGGGGGSTPPVDAGNKSAGSGAAAVQNSLGIANLGLGSLSGGGFTGKPSFRSLKQAKAGSLKASVAGFYKGFKAYKAKAQAVSALAATTTVVSCVDNLPTTATDNIQTTAIDLATGEISITYTNCTTDLGDGTEEVQNGPISFSATATGIGFNLGGSATHYTDTVTRTSDSRLVFATDDNLGVTGTFGLPVTCNSNPAIDSIDLTIGGTSSDREDSEVDGVLDINETTTLTSVGFSISETLDPTSCEATDVGMTQSGAFALVDHLDATNNFSLSVSAGDPLTINSTTVTGPPAGESVTVSGTFTSASGCFTGTLTVATPTPLFIPDGASCPVSGTLTVTGDVIGTVTYSDNSDGVGIQVDEGSDGTVDLEYLDCEDAEACV
jgi:hypothetical protein